MKKYLLLTCGLFYSLFAFSQIGWQWALNPGSNDGHDAGNAICSGPSGYTYVTGFFLDSATFGSHSVASNGYVDMFIAQYDANGNCNWVRNGGGTVTPGDEGLGVAQDSAGNCYVAGAYYGTATFGSITIPGTYNRRSVFLAKYDVNGNVLWVRYSQPSTYNNECRAVAVDPQGNAYITGNIYMGSQTFGSYTLQAPAGFIVKYDPAGNVVYAHQYGTVGGFYFKAIAVDNLGNAYVTGFLSGTDSIGTHGFTATGLNDYFTLKVDAAGSFLWLDQGSTTMTSNVTYIGNGICVNEGRVYVVGTGTGGDETIGTLQVDASVLSGHTTFLLAYDLNGNFVWGEKTSSPDSLSNIEGTAVTTDSYKNVIITGSFSNDFSFVTASMTTGSTLGTNAFVISLTPTASVIFVQQTVGGLPFPAAYPKGISADNQGGVYITGELQFETVFGAFTLTPSNLQGNVSDVFVAKININMGIADESQNTQAIFFAQTDAFHLSIANEELLHNNSVLKIYDMTGRVVQTVKITSAETSISNSDLAPGIYIWQLYSGNTFFVSGKIFKN